jgi:hypothetical protein
VIDFRYHLVSIVSIFLALAVGIVLGAGPLQQQLGQTLTNQVSQLRQDKEDLRSQLDTEQHRIDGAQEFATAVQDELVGSRLGGRSVVLVLLPEADSSVADDVASTLRSAGAKVNGQVKLSTAWADPDPGKITFRDQLATNLGPLVGTSQDAGASVNSRMGALLAKALVVSNVADADRTTSQSEQALSGLREAGLVTVQGKLPPLSTLAVVVAGQPGNASATDARKATLATWTATEAALDAGSSGAVVVGPTASGEPTGALGALRDDKAVAAKVSSVDDADLVMGRIAMVFALRQQMAGQAGHYGTGTGATAVLPPLPADAP